MSEGQPWSLATSGRALRCIYDGGGPCDRGAWDRPGAGGRGPARKGEIMSKRTWALISAFQTVLVVLTIVLIAARPGAAAPDASPGAQTDAARVAEQAAPPPGFLPTITRQEARVIIDGAIEKSVELRGTMTVAVLDAGGNLVSL